MFESGKPPHARKIQPFDFELSERRDVLGQHQFLRAPFNIADVGTNVNSTLGIYYRLVSMNFYRIGLMYRKECREVLDSLRPDGVKKNNDGNGTRGNLHVNSSVPLKPSI